VSVFTFITLTTGLWATLTHRVQLHRRFVTGSYVGLLEAFVGAVAVAGPSDSPWRCTGPLALALRALGIVLLAVALIALARRSGPPRADTGVSRTLIGHAGDAAVVLPPASRQL